MRSRAIRFAVAAAALLMVGSVMVACSSSGTKTESTGSSSTAGNEALLGPVKQASGPPLKIGYIYGGQSQALDTRPELTIAQAAVSYVNEHLGGAGGRPLELVPCTDNFSPSGATDCANQMVAAKVPIVISGQPTQPAAVMQVLEPAQIPFFLYGGLDQSVLLSNDAFVISNPLSIIAAPAKLAADKGTKKVAVLYIDLPAASQTSAIAGPIFQKQGASVIPTAVPAGTPDMTPQVQAAVSQGAGSFLILGDPGFCISAINAMKTLSFQGDIVVNPECLSPAVAKGVSGGLEGVKVASTSSLSSSDPEVALYEAVVAKYAPGTPPHDVGQNGYTIVLALARALTALPATGDVTPAVIEQTLLAMSPQPLPMLSGQTFQCNRQASKLTPSVCSNAVTIITLDANGNAKQSDTFDAQPYLTLG